MGPEVLLSAMYLKDERYVDTLNIKTDCVVINQCDRESETVIEHETASGNINITYVETTERGLSRSRNMALSKAQESICILCDNDVEYVKDYDGIVEEAFDANADADRDNHDAVVGDDKPDDKQGDAAEAEDKPEPSEDTPSEPAADNAPAETIPDNMDVADDGNIRITAPTGEELVYTRNEDGSYNSPTHTESGDEKVSNIRPKIKWTNDIIMQNKKVCGILTEMGVEGETGKIQYVVIGMGINVNQLEEDFPKELKSIAGSVRQACGRKVSRVKLCKSLIEELDTLFSDLDGHYSECLELYRRDCINIGERIKVIKTEEGVEAEAISIEDDFSLRVKYHDGREESIKSGEVSIRGIMGYI